MMNPSVDIQSVGGIIVEGIHFVHIILWPLSLEHAENAAEINLYL